MNHETDDLIRMVGRPELRADSEGLGTLHGHFAVFNEWTTIDSWWEGKFRERIAPGAFSKTITENRSAMKVLYDHGMDPTLGNKPLGSIDVLEEDSFGGRYEVPLFDASYVRDLVPALAAGELGSSFRFRVIKDEWTEPDDDSNDLPERTILEAKVYEFGPVTFPAYQAATAGIRSRHNLELWQSLDEDGRAEFVRLLSTQGTPLGAANLSTEPSSGHSRASLDQRARRIRQLLNV